MLAMSREQEARRYFTCGCGHKLRFGAKRCGKCKDTTPFFNRVWFWDALAIGGTFIAIMSLLGVLTVTL